MFVITVRECVTYLENEASGAEGRDDKIVDLFYTPDEAEAKRFCEQETEKERSKREKPKWDVPWKEYSYKVAKPLPAAA